MAKVLVAGLINFETTLRVDGFPLPYLPVSFPFWGVNSTVSGVGYNLGKALTLLGDDARFLSLIGQDGLGQLVLQALAADGIPAQGVLPALAQTPQSVILYDGKGQRAIHVDLKDIQEQTYPWPHFEAALEGCDLAVLCNINFARPFLAAAQARGIPIATDVHTIADLDDAYNRDFMAAADILFMSDEQLPVAPEAWARRILQRYGPKIVVIGLGRATRRFSRARWSTPSARGMRSSRRSSTSTSANTMPAAPCAKPCSSPRTKSAKRARRRVS